jgi:hypothetical protein
MGGTSPHAGVNIGRGGLQGLQFSEQQRRDEEQAALRQLQAQQLGEFRQATIQLSGARERQAEKHQTTDEMLRGQGLAQGERHQLADEGFRGQDLNLKGQTVALEREKVEQGRYTYQPGMGPDPADPTSQVQGVYKLPTKGDEQPTFTPGINLTGKPAAGGAMGSREGVQFQRVVNAGNSATTALKNIAELPSTTSSGWFGPRQPGHSLMGAAKESLANTLTSQDVQSYNTMVTGVARNLSTLETSGLAPSGSFTDSMNSTILKEGDTEITKLRKMAEIRQIIETNLEPSLHNPRLPKEMQEYVRTILNNVRDTVPFSHHDITQLNSSKSGQTLQDVVTARGLNGKSSSPSAAPTAPAAPAPRIAPSLPPGVPAGSMYSPSRNMWRDPATGQTYPGAQ